ncbi:MAG TPA: ATP-binding protein [Leptolyngbyaceae cyanobacterium]
MNEFTMINNAIKILVVDDQPNNLRFLSNVLKERGYQVQRAINGQLALNAALLSPPDLILLDIMLPDINGYEVCASLKTTEQTKDIPVIFLSALNETQEKVKAFRIGGVDYITKPFQSEEVLARIESQLTIQKLQKQLKQQNEILQNQIKERQQTEKSLKQAHQQLAFHVENSPLAVIEWNHQFRVQRWSAQAEKIFGWAAREVLNKSWDELEFVFDEDFDEVTQVITHLLNGTQTRNTCHNRNYTKDGSVVHCEWYNSALLDNAGNLVSILSLALDVSNRKKAEAALRASEALYAGIFNHSAEAIFLLNVSPDEKFIFETINPTSELVMGISAGDIRGKTPAEVVSNQIAIHFEERYRACVAAGVPISYEESLTLPIGNRTWRTILIPIRDAAGNIIKLQGSSRDITDEIRQRQELARSNAELEQFAYIASHDLQAPLATITSYAQLLEQRYKEKIDAKGERFIRNIVQGTMRMQSLIDDLLEYSRVGRNEQPFEAIDCNMVFEEACANLQLDIYNNQAVVTCDKLPTVMGDFSRLVQLFQNLIGNGIKYRRQESPNVNITISRREDAWLFAVKDNGIGIEPKYSDRIFQIFQRLHSRNDYAGTGIGLAICKKIVESHGGQIWVESQPGQGSTFYFTLGDLKN